MKYLSPVVLILLIFSSVSMAQHFESVPATGIPYSIICNSARVNDVDLNPNDEIGIFDADLCVGMGIVDHIITPDEVLALMAWQGHEVNDTTILPGFTPDNPISFKMYLSAFDIEVDAIADFITGDGTFGYGAYSVVTLTATIEGRITGVVSECTNDGPPIENVQVYLEGELACITDANGAYSIEGLFPGSEHNLRFEHECYFTEHANRVQVPPVHPFEGIADIVMEKPDAEVTENPLEIVVYVGWVFDDSTGSGVLEMTHTGCADLDWTASVVNQEHNEWLSIIPAEGQLGVGENVNIEVLIDFSDVGFPVDHGTEILSQIQFAGDHWCEAPLIDVVIDCFSDVSEKADGIPGEYYLSQNFPNPFNPVTEITFALPVNEYVNLSVFNIMGQEIATLIDSDLAAGIHKVNFNAASLSSGIYFYRVETATFQDMKKMLFVK